MSELCSRANEGIVRERHPIPTVEELLHDLNGSTVFSNVDLRTVPTFVAAHTLCASGDTWVSYGWCLLIQGYFCAV